MGRVPDWLTVLTGRESGAGPESAGASDGEPPVSPKEHSKRVAELFEAHNSALMRFLTCKLKSTHEAKEVAQEAYVRVLQLDAPGGVSHLQAFLFKTASNLASDRLKSEARRERIDQIDFFDEAEVAPSPENGVAAVQQMERVLTMIEELPAKCRYAFIMQRFYGHDFYEVARLMNISERMVRLYVERAVVFCRERLLDTGGER